MHRQDQNKPIVLVVEDEWLLRVDAVEIVRAAGFEPLEAATADEAIAILESRDDIRVVFTDVQIPGSMDGLRLARAIRGRWPPIRVVATSGRIQLNDNELPSGGRFVPKPYTPSQISSVLAELVA
ncbi:response regulator [Rhodopseudomonas sp. B29]|uniref:response regulator n=1 Tax=Rhodopseudomonas sp. B29 TaxID=95607 RepID=UPI0003B6997C|nr:response regulator [Rhodopseudomonas sp. B29]